MTRSGNSGNPIGTGLTLNLLLLPSEKPGLISKLIVINGDAKLTEDSQQTAFAKFKPVLEFTPSMFRVFCLIGLGMTYREIANMPGRKTELRTVWRLAQQIRYRMDCRHSEVVKLASQFLKSGLKLKKSPRHACFEMIQ